MVSVEAGVAQCASGLLARDPSATWGVCDAPAFWPSRGVLDAPTLTAFEAEDEPRRSPGDSPVTDEGWDLMPEGEVALMAVSGQAEAVGEGALWFGERGLTMRAGDDELPGTWDERAPGVAAGGPAPGATELEPQAAGTGRGPEEKAVAVRRAGGLRGVPVWCAVVIVAAGLLFLVGLRALLSAEREEA